MTFSVNVFFAAAVVKHAAALISSAAVTMIEIIDFNVFFILHSPLLFFNAFTI